VFVASFAVAVAAVAFLFVMPHWKDVAGEFASNMKIGMGSHHRLGKLLRFLWFGYRTEPGMEQLVPVGFFIQEAALIASAGILAVVRLLGLERRRLGDLERCCWIWLAVTFAFVATQSYQPDRRYLLSAPPLAILLGLAAAARRDEGIEPDAPARPGALRWLAAWAVAAFTLGLLARPWGCRGSGRSRRGSPSGPRAGSARARCWRCCGWPRSGSRRC